MTTPQPTTRTRDFAGGPGSGLPPPSHAETQVQRSAKSHLDRRTDTERAAGVELGRAIGHAVVAALVNSAVPDPTRSSAIR